MSSATTSSRAVPDTGAAPGQQRLLIVLLFIAIALNYVDRQVLALLKPTLQHEFRWTDADYAHLGSAFQLAAVVSFLFVGWFVDRLGVRRALGVGVVIWSLAGAAHAFAGSVRQFVIARVVLAAAETVGTPAALKAAAVYLPLEIRSFALALGNAAPNVGTIVTPLLIVPFAVRFGWQAAFLVTGGLGLVWLIFWILGTRKLTPVVREGRAAAEATAVPFRELLSDRRTWAIIGAKPLSDFAWFFMLFWIPDFMARVFQLKQGELGWPVALVYSFAAAGALSSGVLFPRFVAAGWSVNRARKTSMLIYACIILILPLALIVTSPWIAAVIIDIALFAHQGFSTNVFGLTADIVPSNRVATVISFGAVAGNLGGFAIIEFAGWSLTHGHGYWPMFVLCACGYLLALGWIQLLLPTIHVAE